MQSMRKKELIHLHGLTAEVTSYCMEEDDLSINLSEYNSLEAKPSSIFCRKEEHQKAIFALTESITEALYDKQKVVMSANSN